MKRSSLFSEITEALMDLADPDRAVQMARFFKTGPGDYGAGDVFLGISVPEQRALAGQFKKQIDLETVGQLLDSGYHEVRLTAVFLLNLGFQRDDRTGMGKPWVDLYLSKTDRINNWDLVDSSAHIVLGRWLEHRDRDVLYRLAESDLLWDNRIAMVATLHFIRQGDISDCLRLAERFLEHPHDLMHKASGWMLREAWKRKPEVVEDFLNQYADSMPRTMLRYAIEKMEETARKTYLGKVPDH
jgi:3-methyladenine DNA glycosylase AlkD